MALMNHRKVKQIIMEGVTHNGRITTDYLKNSFNQDSFPDSEIENIAKVINEAVLKKIGSGRLIDFQEDAFLFEIIEKIANASAIPPRFRTTPKKQKNQLIMGMVKNIEVQKGVAII
ncbi:MAG: hypothetical protein MUF15_14030 [Acidobacteria bacterium]|jgi:hypothetical protein|nr:hypothetical protein [Acidobacteriota bacterium]